MGRLLPYQDCMAPWANLGFERLTITDDHLRALETLPWHHRDPFDRLLICQALIGGLGVLTADDIFAKYGPLMVDARR